MLFINAVTLVTEVGPGRKVSLKLFFMYCHVKYMKVYVKKLHANGLCHYMSHGCLPQLSA